MLQAASASNVTSLGLMAAQLAAPRSAHSGKAAAYTRVGGRHELGLMWLCGLRCGQRQPSGIGPHLARGLEAVKVLQLEHLGLREGAARSPEVVPDVNVSGTDDICEEARNKRRVRVRSGGRLRNAKPDGLVADLSRGRCEDDQFKRCFTTAAAKDNWSVLIKRESQDSSSMACRIDILASDEPSQTSRRPQCTLGE